MPQEKKDGCCSTNHVDVWSRYTAALTGGLICAVGVLDIIKVFGGTQKRKITRRNRREQHSNVNRSLRVRNEFS